MAKKNEDVLHLRDLDMSQSINDKKTYKERLKELQKRMLDVQQAYFHQNRRAILIFEGWDASGKGGAIRRLTERLDPRGCKVWPIGAPRPDEQGRHYLWRFWQRLPEPGGIAIFDRSWYGRVLVERVEGLAPEADWQRAYREIRDFEQMLLDDGARIIKMFIHITPEEQLKRFEKRLKTPHKRWKITPEDLRNRERWDDYEAAINDMFARTSSEAAPWTAIPGNQKHFARIKVLETVIEEMSRGVEIVLPDVDPEVEKIARKRFGLK